MLRTLGCIEKSFLERSPHSNALQTIGQQQPMQAKSLSRARCEWLIQAGEGYQPLEDNPNESKQKAINLEKINQFLSYEPGTELKLTGKFVIIKDTKKEVMVNGRNVVIMENCALLDHSGWVQLSVWEDCFPKLEHGHSYVLEPVQIKQLLRKYLGTMRKTEIQPCTLSVSKKL